MTKRPDGLTDYEDLSPAQQAQARDWCARPGSTIVADDAPLFAFFVTKRGDVSRSNMNRRTSTAFAAAIDAETKRRVA